MKHMRMLFSIKSAYFVLVLILLLAACVRLYRLETFPVGFHIDEAIIGDTAYSLLLTGKDYDGRAFPLNVEVFNDYVPAGYHYLTILPVAIMGLTVVATRLPGALIGALMVLPIYFFSFILFKRKSIALLSALLVALSPWAVVFSRATSETVVSLFFVIAGFVFLLYSLEKKSIIHIFLASIFLGLSFFFYHTPRVFVPLFFFATIALYYFPWKRKNFFHFGYYSLSFISLCVLSFALVFVLGGGTNRFSQTSIFTNPGTKLIMEEQIREDGVLATPATITRLFHNKISNYSLAFLSNYLSYFDGNVLFMSGGKPIIFSVPDVGMLYLAELPFLLIGIVALASSKKPLHYIPLIWVLLAPVVAALTLDDSPNMRRAIELFPMLDIISAYGCFVVISFCKGKWKILVIGMISIFFIVNVTYFFHEYFVHTLIHRPWERNNGFGQMVATISAHAAHYDKIVITRSKGTIWPLIVFYSEYNPKTYQREGSTKDTAYTGFGNYFFVPEACPSLVHDPKYPKGKLLFVEHGEVCKKQVIGKSYQFIYRGDGTKAFRIVY